MAKGAGRSNRLRLRLRLRLRKGWLKAKGWRQETGAKCRVSGVGCRVSGVGCRGGRRLKTEDARQRQGSGGCASRLKAFWKL